ncbi:amidohydrolase [Bacillus horti]|uniref:Amidohydrolase YtcJ n=1 Tax=Caldalkalibacillus horti TaxID=77523 RepID=A0ABT9W4E4_9BACI|nr:amidohydrolase [Bacillus horti]MDQ0168116.1 putative amidohydrolase YtcJ [Bacillus horti]
MSEQIFFNANVYTLDQQKERATGVYTKNGQILEVGDGEQLKAKYAGFETDLIDVQGGMMIPGLVDSHMHLIAHGMKLRSVDFSSCTDALEMKRMLEEKIAMTAEGEWIIGRGWNENNFADRKIFSKTELDEMTSRHPIFLTRICGHAFLVNSMALAAAGLDQHSPDPVGGKLERDAAGHLTGLLLENAGPMIQQHIPAEMYEELKASLEAAISDCWRTGLVGCHSEDVRYSGGFLQTVKLYDEVLHQDQQLFRVNQLVYFEHIDEMLQAGKKYGDGTAFFDIGAMKIFADGAMGGRSALLSQPYSDDPSKHGVAIHTQQELEQLVQKARTAHLPIAVHTIGDKALDMTLQAIEKHPVLSGQLDRIIHAQVLNPQLIERMQRLALIVDIQPRFVVGDFPWVMERLGEERLPWSYAWKTLLESGLICAGGSDAPIEPIDPLLGLHAAVTRTKPEESFHEGYIPEQKLTPLEALHLFTTGSAKAEQKLHLKGTITPGKLADFTILDQDLFTLPSTQWLKTKVIKTVVHGKVVYEA